jgi:hypothetical protein
MNTFGQAPGVLLGQSSLKALLDNYISRVSYPKVGVGGEIYAIVVILIFEVFF